MLALNDVHRTEPIYLCATHAAETKHLPAESKSKIESSKSAPVAINSKTPAAEPSGVPNTQPGRRYRYFLLLVAILALAAGLFGPRLFRAIRPRSRMPALMAQAHKRTVSTTLSPKTTPQKVQLPAPQEQPQPAPQVRRQPVLSKNTQPPERSLQTSNVTVEGTIARKVLPDVPKSASDTIRGTILVSVKVQVDASGNVERTELVRAGPSRYFARKAVESAQRWNFNPPVAAGQRLQSEWLIDFYFTREATKALATRAAGPTSPQKP